MRVKQIIVTGQNQVEFKELDMNESLGPDEILLKTEWTFISAGTELANYTGREPDVFVKGAWCAYPWNSGYANVGKVKAIGSNVTCCKVGDRLFSSTAHSSFVKANQNGMVAVVPNEIDPCVAAATRMAGVSTSSVVMAEQKLHPWVGVFGLGMVGNLAAQSFRILGARVIGIDPVASRRKRAGDKCGIRWTIGGTPEEAQKEIAKITDGQMLDVAVEATGLTPVVLQALKATVSLGQLVLLGSPRAPFQGDITPAFKDIHLRYITVRGALEWASPVYPPTTGQGARALRIMSLYEKQMMIFDWVKDGSLVIEPLITHRLPPTEIKQAYEGLLRDSEKYIGVALDWRKM